MGYIYLFLALISISGYYTRWLLKESIPEYKITEDVFHAVMQFVMCFPMFGPIEWRPVLFPIAFWTFIAFGFYYVFRNRKRSYDLEHATLAFGTAYMFVELQRHLIQVDILLSIYFLWIGIKYLFKTLADWKNTDMPEETKLCNIILDLLHLVMGPSMSYMNLVMFILPLLGLTASLHIH